MKRFKEENLVSNWQNLPFLGNSAKWYRYHNRVVSVPPMQRPIGTGTTHQNMIGTGTNPSGTGTTASCNPNFWYSYIVKLKFAYQAYRNPNK